MPSLASAVARLRFGGALAAFVGIASLGVAPAQAGITASGYWQETKAESCSFIICSVAFSKVPTGKQIIVTNVSCNLKFTGTGPIRSADLGSRINPTTLSPVHTYLKLSSNGPDENVRYYTINDPVTHILRAGESPFVTFTITGAAGVVVSCTLSGLIKP